MDPPGPPYGHQTSNYEMFSQQHEGGSLRPPPYRRNIPRYDSKGQKSSSSSGFCFRCIGCCYCILFVLVFASAALTFFLYTVYRPQVPSYGVEHFGVNAFNVTPDTLTADAEFVVVVKADNPNENIGFVYGKDSRVAVSYSDAELCSGALPAFHQPVKNVTVMRVVLSGDSDFGAGLQQALIDSRESGQIPLLVRVRVPVSVVLGNLPLRQVVVLVNCSLVVDSLQPDKKAKILSTNYSYNVQF